MKTELTMKDNLNWRIHTEESGRTKTEKFEKWETKKAKKLRNWKMENEHWILSTDE
jgi:hypothetical protein